MAKVIIFDLETRKLAQELCPDDIEKGWTMLKAGEGGISVLALYDTQEDWTYFYDDTLVEHIARYIESADVVVGYNSIKFDIPVIEGVLGRKLAIKYNLDLYSEIAQANARKGILTRRGDLTLGSVSQRCLGQSKIGSGALAPDLLRTGKFCDLFNYCSHDVKLTRDLLKYICEHGGVQNINNGFLGLEIPDYIKEAVI